MSREEKMEDDKKEGQNEDVSRWADVGGLEW